MVVLSRKSFAMSRSRLILKTYQRLVSSRKSFAMSRNRLCLGVERLGLDLRLVLEGLMHIPAMYTRQTLIHVISIK